jgi:hypothetical protein
MAGYHENMLYNRCRHSKEELKTVLKIYKSGKLPPWNSTSIEDNLHHLNKNWFKWFNGRQ